MLYLNHQNPWSSVIGFGTIKPSFLSMDEGVVFGIWETGPWIGVKYRTSESFKWVGMGENWLSDLQVWRHTCLSIDFVNGLVKLIENGEIQNKTQN